MWRFLKFSYKLSFFLILLLALFAKHYEKELTHFAKDIVLRFVDKADEGKDISLQFSDTNDNSDPNKALFTSAQLSKYTGENGAPIYLALLGSVFDVSRGVKHYGPGCSYSYFAGRDASVSFISGEFENYDADTADDVLTLKSDDLLGLANWKDFYEKDYIYKGKLIGRFYNDHGEPTQYYHKYLALLDHARAAKKQVEELRSKYPDCNIEWSETKGTRVWCTTTSGGGKARDWTGYPRKLYNRGSKDFHCACVPEEELHDLDNNAATKAAHGEAMFKPYDNCEPRAFECFYNV